MSAVVNFSIDLNKIPKDKVKKKNGQAWLDLTIGLNDDTNEYGNNAAVWVRQSYEQYKVKDKKEYLGNGRVAYSSGNVVKAEVQQKDDADGLDF